MPPNVPRVSNFRLDRTLTGEWAIVHGSCSLDRNSLASSHAFQRHSQNPYGSAPGFNWILLMDSK
jgi:hypothetical protein